MIGEAEWSMYVTLYDRNLIYKNQKQLYGTQYSFVNGYEEFAPMDSIEQVNERRKKFGLNPVEVPHNIRVIKTN